MSDQLRILFCPDLSVLDDQLGSVWIASFASYLKQSNFAVSILLNREIPALEKLLVDAGARVLYPEVEPDLQGDSDAVPPRYHARSVLREALQGRQIQYEVVLTQGIALSRYVAGSKLIQPAHWAIIADNPLLPADAKTVDLESVKIVSTGARLLLFTAPEMRSFIESRIPAATSKTRLLEPVQLNRPAITQASDDEFIFDFNRFGASWRGYQFDQLVSQAKAQMNPPRVVVVDSSKGESDFSNPLDDYPGAIVVESFTQIPDGRTGVYAIPSAHPEADVRLLRSTLRASDQTLFMSDWSVTLNTLTQPVDPPSPLETVPFRRLFESDLPDYERTPLAKTPIRVLLAGADFKFAGDLVDALIQRADIELSVDLFEANAKPQPSKSKPLLQSAEVIIAEFASKNAIWYSHNVRPDQQLIVHLHGYELLQDWITELNVDNCAAIVFASDFYRQKAIEMRGWPAEKLVVVPNSVNFGDLARRKSRDARFNIGLVGIVPILKRPDRAIDLLEKLVAVDERFTLHIRGHSPWNYGWEWKKSAHQDSYREFYRRIGSNPVLRHRVVFEPFSPDMANWLQDIGWLLSPSTRETFHLSAIEGAASGAVPIAWRREGSDEIIGEQFNFDSTDEIASYILDATPEHCFAEVSDAAQRHARKYDVSQVRAQWLELIFSLKATSTESTVRSSAADQVLSTVRAAWHEDDPETSVAILDEHIPLTRNHKGPLKDAEMFFRGIAAADEKRFTQFLPLQRNTTDRSENIAAVRPIGATFDAIDLAPAVTKYVGVEPPKFIQLDGYDPYIQSSVALEAPNDQSIRVDGHIRLDRWFEIVKARLMPTALAHGELIVQGPWWVALPALQAADQAGIRSTWLIDDLETLKWIAEASRGGLRTHFGAQIAWNAFQATTVRGIFGEIDLPSDFDLSTVDCSVGPNKYGIPKWDPTQPYAAHYCDGPLARTNAPGVLVRDLADTRIGFVADRSMSKEWSQVVDVIDLSPDSYLDQIDASIDLAVIHPSGNSSGPWAKLLESANDSAQNDATKLLDRARLNGATTCFIWDSPDVLPQKLWAVARKADAIAVTFPAALQRFLQINPSAVRAIGWWDTNLPLEKRLQVALRGVYQPVALDRSAVENHYPVSDFRKEADALLDPAGEELPTLERIAVFTDHDRSEWSAQTLPQTLFEIYPISEFPNRRNLGVDYFVIFDDALPPEDHYLLSLWLDATEDAVVFPEGFDAMSETPETQGFVANALYPISGEPVLGKTRRAPRL